MEKNVGDRRKKKEIKYYGERASDAGSMTDQVHTGSPPSKKLGKYPSSETKNDSDKREEQLRQLNAQIQALAEGMPLVVEVELLENKLTDKKAGEMIGKNDFSMLQYYGEIDPEVLKTLFESEVFIEKMKKAYTNEEGAPYIFGMPRLTDDFIGIANKASRKNPGIRIRIFLNGINSEQADKITQLETKSFIDYGAKDLTREVAEELAQFKGTAIVLNGLTSLAPEVAEKLTTFQCKHIYMSRYDYGPATKILNKNLKIAWRE